MNIALIGYGYWGKKVYKSLKKDISIKDIYIVDSNIKNIPNNLKTATLKKVLIDKDINYIFIVTPEETHFEIAKQCLENKKNIFVEKPLCLKKNEAEKLRRIAKKNNVKIYVDYIFLHDPYVKRIKKIIADGIIGNLQHIESIRHSINIHKPNISVFDDLATHDIYLGKYFFGENISNFKTIKKSINSKQINQASSIFYYGEKTLSANYSWVHPTSQRKMTFWGSKATLTWNKNEKDLLFYKNYKLIEKIKVNTTTSPLELSIEKFFLEKNNYNYTSDVEIIEKLNNS